MSDIEYSYTRNKRERCDVKEEDDVDESSTKHRKFSRQDLEALNDVSKVFAKKNHIYFNGSVNKNTIYKMKELIDKLNDDYKLITSKNDMYNMTPKPIYLHINSYGGGVFAAFAGVDFIKQSAIPVHTIIEGASASAATILSVVGEKRYMSRHGSMLIHQLSSWMGGKMSDMDDEYKNLEEMMDNITKIYLKHTTIKKKDLVEYLKHDRWWDFNKCKQAGLIDAEWKGDS
jgi:ATP-dependent protease ClpP protease subunit